MDGARSSRWQHRRGRVSVRFDEVLPVGHELRPGRPVCGNPPDGARSRRRGGLGGAQRRGARRGPALRRPVLVPVQRPTLGQGDLPDLRPDLVRLRRHRERTAHRADVPRQHDHVGLRAAPPMASYLATVQIGRYVTTPVPGPTPTRSRSRSSTHRPAGPGSRWPSAVRPRCSRRSSSSSGRTRSRATPSSSRTTPWRSRSRPRRCRRSAPTTYAPTGAPNASSRTSWLTSGSATA